MFSPLKRLGTDVQQPFAVPRGGPCIAKFEEAASRELTYGSSPAWMPRAYLASMTAVRSRQGSCADFVHGLTDGLTRELELVERFKSLGKTTVLTIKPDEDPFASLFSSQADQDAKRLAFEVLYEALAKRFGTRLALVQQLTDSNTEEIVDRIRTRVARKEQENPDQTPSG